MARSDSRTTPRSRPAVRPLRVLCPTDFGTTGDQAIEFACRLAGPEGAVHVFHVYDAHFRGTYVDSRFVVASEEHRENIERGVRARVLRLFPSASTVGDLQIVSRVRNGSLTAEVLEEARRLDVDLIVMGTRGQAGVVRFLLGSAAAEVMRRSSVPVLLVHSPTRGAAVRSPAPSRSARP